MSSNHSQHNPNVLQNSIVIIQELIKQANSAPVPDFDDPTWVINDELNVVEERANKVIIRIFGETSDYLGQIFTPFTSGWGDLIEKQWLEGRREMVNALTNFLDELRLTQTSEENAMMAKNEIKMGDGTVIYGDLITANSINDSFNKYAKAENPSELKEILIALAKEVAKINEVLPKESYQQTTRDLEVLTAEATSPSPRTKWIHLSAEGLKQAAINVGEIGKPVIALVAQILSLLRL